MNMMSYRKLFYSTATSWLIMYSVMYLNVSEVSDLYLSLIRLYMSLLMTAPIVVVMIVIMSKMFENKAGNAISILSATIVFIGSLAGLRAQVAVGDEQ